MIDDRSTLHVQETNEKADGYFGLCPVCHRTDGYISIGPDHWFLCEEHKKKWFVGSNLFSYDEIKDEQDVAQMDLGSFEKVQPFYKPAFVKAPAAPPPPEADAKTDATSAPPGRRIRPGVVYDEEPCVICGRETRSDAAGAILEDENAGELRGGGLCEACHWNFLESEDGAVGWLANTAANLRSRADFMDVLRKHPPEVAPAEEWNRAHARARVRRLIAEAGGCAQHLDEKLLDLFAAVLEKQSPDVDDIPF